MEQESVTETPQMQTIINSIGMLKKSDFQIIRRYKKNYKWKSLGRGGFGEVFAIDDWIDVDGKHCSAALKKPQPKPGAGEILHKEIESLSKLNHLFVVKYLGLAEMECKNEISTVIAMELCEGDLKTYVLEGLPKIPKGSLNNRIILGQVVLGLAYIHGLGILHKDLKPDNILLWKSPSGLVLAKLADFGFSKCLRIDQTEHSDTTHFGSWGYMAPELLIATSSEPKQPTKCTYATDAYALGIVISFTANGGKHPFGQNRIFRDFFMSIGTAPTELDADWDLTDLVARLAYKDPKKRPQTDIVIYHPYFVLSNHRSRNSFTDKVFSSFVESFADWNFTYEGINSSDNEIKLEWFQNNFRHNITSLEWEQTNRTHMASSSITKNSAFLPTAEAETTNQQEPTSPSSLPLLFPASGLNEKAGSNPSSFDRKIKERLATNTERNIMETIKLVFRQDISGFIEIQCTYSLLQSGDYSRLHACRLVTSNAPEMLTFYIWCLIYYMTPQVFMVLGSTNDHFKRCFKMTEFEYATLHYNDEHIQEVWNLKYESENGESTRDEDYHHLFFFTSSSVFPSFMWETLVRCFEKKINSTENGINGRSLLHWVAFNEPSFEGTNESPEKLIRLIVEKGGDANAVDIFGITPVHAAARNPGIHACVTLKILLEEGRGDPNFPNQRSVDPVLDAILSLISVEKLKDFFVKKIQTGINDTTQLDREGNTAATNNIPVDSPIQDPFISFFDDEGNLLSHFKSLLQNLKIPLLLHPRVLEGLGSIVLGLLIKNSGCPVVQNLNGRTPVHCAAANESPNGPELLKLLLNHNGNPNLNDCDGWTALHCAAANKGGFGPIMMEALLQRGGDPAIVNKDGKTALDLATLNRARGGAQMVEMLEKHQNISAFISPEEKKIKLENQDCPPM